MKGFAPVSPIWLLQKMGKMAGKYHLPLAHDVLRYPGEYFDMFQDMGTDRTVILDNSVIELGDAVTVNMLLEAAGVVRATHIVMPDKLENSTETFRLSYTAWHEMKDKIDVLYRVAVVPQGENLEAWILCAEQMADTMPIDLWCVPRNYEGRLGDRRAACEILRVIKDIPIHLIGFSNWIYRDMYSAAHPNVIGIDSAVPVRIGQEGKDIMMSSLYKSRGAWFDSVNEETPLEKAVLRNLNKVRRWLNP
jgi:hypothetical protein